MTHTHSTTIKISNWSDNVARGVLQRWSSADVKVGKK